VWIVWTMDLKDLQKKLFQQARGRRWQKMAAQWFSEDKLSKMERGYTPANTNKSTHPVACISNHSQWQKQQNANATDNEKCLECLPLSQYPAQELWKWGAIVCARQERKMGKHKVPSLAEDTPTVNSMLYLCSCQRLNQETNNYFKPIRSRGWGETLIQRCFARYQ